MQRCKCALLLCTIALLIAYKLSVRWGLAQDARMASLSKKFSLAATAKEQLQNFCKEPHPFGSKRQKELAKWLLEESRPFASGAQLQQFHSLTPNPKNFPKVLKGEALTLQRQGQNILASVSMAKKPQCYVVVGSHYDSKYLKDQWSVGANDSGSTSILLLHIGKYLNQIQTTSSSFQCDPLLVWFDGEEAVLPNWDDGERRYIKKIHDNTYGSRYFTSQLQPCGKHQCFTYSSKVGPLPIRSMVLLDMLGSASIRITDDLNSSLNLRKLLKASAKLLNDPHILSQNAKSILDDHIPFLQAGIPSLNIIDFENLHFWHKPSDKPSHIHLPSLNRAGRLSTLVLLQLLSKPQDF